MKLLYIMVFPLFPLGVWLAFLFPVILVKSEGVGKKNIVIKRRKWLSFFTLLLTIALAFFIVSIIIPVELGNNRYMIMGLSLQFFGLISLVPSMTPLLASIASDVTHWYLGGPSPLNETPPTVRRLRSFFNVLFGTSMVGFNTRTFIWGLLAFGFGLFLQFLGIII